MQAMPDPLFADPRWRRPYDIVDDDRSDLGVYAGIVAELMASSVLDVGCGTGTLACRLARLGIEAVGLNPAAASLDVARRKPGAERVRWIHGGASSALPLAVDLAVMTGNVAQGRRRSRSGRTAVGTSMSWWLRWRGIGSIRRSAGSARTTCSVLEDGWHCSATSWSAGRASLKYTPRPPISTSITAWATPTGGIHRSRRGARDRRGMGAGR